MEQKMTIIAGPCSAESEEQVLATAAGVKAAGVEVFRAGIWKPRTHPGCFEGVGVQGLPWLSRVKRELGLKVCTEVASAKHVEACLAAGLDLLWIGARTTVNPFLMQEIADALKGSDIPVLVKNPINPDIELWSGAVERLQRSGVGHIGLILRGFSSLSESKYRNSPRWSLAFEMKSRHPELDLICDPSHMAGKRDYVPELSQRALDLGFDGLMVESHIRPTEALSDAAQQLTPDELVAMLSGLQHRCGEIGGGDIERYRAEIDECDELLIKTLCRRMRASEAIGRCKKAQGVQIFQFERWEEVMEKAVGEGVRGGLEKSFVERLFNNIHAASIKIQK